jgi:multiple sugar transport system substrate-binding protein
LLAAGAASLLVLTAGCGATTSNEPNSIRVMLWGNNVDLATIKDAAAGFIEDNPDIDVVFETGDCAVDYAACKTLIAGKNMADVVVTGSWNYFEMANDGVLADLTPFIEEDDFNLGDLTPSIVDALTAPDGAIHALPMGYNVQSLFYNEDMFAAAGLDAPPADGSYTWDDLRDWSKKLTLDANGNNAESADFDSENIVQYGFFNFAAALIEPGYAPIVAAHGGAMLDGEERNECAVDSAETIEAFQLLQDMMWKDHSMITPQLQQEEPGFIRWGKGQVAMQQGSHEQVPLVAESNPELNYNMAALPAGPAGNATLMQIHTWAMYEGSNSKDAAWDFIDYMATDGSGKQMGLIPAYKDVALGDAFAQAPGEPSNLIAAQVDPASWPLSFTNIDPSGVWGAVSGQDGFGPALEDIMSNRASAEEALGGLCESKINEVLDRQQ